MASACPERAQVPSTLCSPPEPARARERPSFDFPPLTEAAAALAAHISVRLTFPYTTFTACCAAVAIAITAIATTASTAAAVAIATTAINIASSTIAAAPSTIAAATSTIAAALLAASA